MGLENNATIETILTTAQTKMNYWHQRADDIMGSDRTTIAAARVLARAYEQILARVQKAKQYLDYE